MSLLAAHMQKEKAGNLIGLQKHIDRKNKNYQNENIDLSLSDQNYSLTENHDKQNSLYQEVKNYVDENKTSNRAIRKDAVLVNAWVIGSDKDFMNHLGIDEQKEYFQTAYKYFADKFGENNIRYATVHVDEIFEGQANPHLHLGVTPLKDGKLSGKTVFNRQTLREIQEELPIKLQQAGFGIERGIEGSESKHLDERSYRDYQEALKNEVEEPKQELKNQYLDIITDLKPDAKVSDKLYMQHKELAHKEKRGLWFAKKFGERPEEIHTEYGRNQVSEWSSLDKLKRYAITLIQRSMDWVRDKTEELKTRETELEKAETPIMINWSDLLTRVGYSNSIVNEVWKKGYYTTITEKKVDTGRQKLETFDFGDGTTSDMMTPIFETKKIKTRHKPQELFEKALRQSDKYIAENDRTKAAKKYFEDMKYIKHEYKDEDDDISQSRGRGR